MVKFDFENPAGADFFFFPHSSPSETDHLTHPTKESAHHPRRNGVKTGLTTETGRTGRTGRCLLPWTKPRAEIESGPSHLSGTDAPAQTSESLGRYDRRGKTSDIFETYCLVEGSWRQIFLLVQMHLDVVSFVCLFILKSDQGKGGGKKQRWWQITHLQTFFFIFLIILRRARKQWIWTKWKPYFQSRFISLSFKCCFCL